jgi:catechol 2,3-dioxygenase-like lactoylglutathione lyase family enzyme
MRLGPIAGATLIVRDLAPALSAYVDGFGLIVVEKGPLERQRALDMGEVALIDAPSARLRCSSETQPWLTLIEAPQARLSEPFSIRGWAAFSLLVSDLEALAGRLNRGSWTVLHPPANAAPTASRDMLQVAGPGGEVLNIFESTERTLNGGFAIGRIYAATLAVADMAAAMGFYQGLGLLDRSSSQVFAPIPTPAVEGHLRANHQIEFVCLPSLPGAAPDLRQGIRLISFARSDARGRLLRAQSDPSARILAGPDGEAIELV